MKRKATKTEFRYFAGQWSHHKGPVENVRFDPELRTVHMRAYVNVPRYNDIQLARKLRLASYVDAPILRKHATFTNNPNI